MTRFTTICTLSILFSGVVLMFAPPALAADGVVLINPNTSLNGLPGCPHTGFPITICQPGSYRLSEILQIQVSTSMSYTLAPTA